MVGARRRRRRSRRPARRRARTSALSPRPPSASDSASSRIDLPAPVSPVSTVSPAREIDAQPVDEDDVADREGDEHGAHGAGRAESGRVLAGERLADPRRRSSPRGSTPFGLEELVGVLVPAAVGEIVAEHRGGGLRLAGRGPCARLASTRRSSASSTWRVSWYWVTTTLKRLIAAMYWRCSR